MGRSFSFSQAYDRRDRMMPQTSYDVVADASDGDPRAEGHKDRWVQMEEKAKQLQMDEGRVEGADKIEYRTFIDARGRKTRLSKDAALGLHGQDVTIHGGRATFLKREIEVKGGRPTGNVIEYFQREGGGTYAVHGEKVAEGRHRMTVRRVHEF
jgi:hypothetical protein